MIACNNKNRGRVLITLLTSPYYAKFLGGKSIGKADITVRKLFTILHSILSPGYEISCHLNKYLNGFKPFDTINVSGSQLEYFYEILLSLRPYIWCFFHSPLIRCSTEDSLP